jgi:hypothetical protein
MLVPIHDGDADSPIAGANTIVPQSGDWLVEFDHDNDHFYLMKVDEYKYVPLKHLYVKHFAIISHFFSVDKRQASHLFLSEANQMDHMSKFSQESVHSLLRYFESQIKLQAKKELTRKTARKPRTRKPTAGLKYGTRWPRAQPIKLSSQWKDIKLGKGNSSARMSQPNKQNPNKNLDKKAWAIFSSRFPDQQPKKGQIVEIRNEIIEQEAKK